MKTRIVGLGNDLLSDDGVGLEVVRELKRRLGPRNDVEYRESPAGGMRLLDDLLGSDRAVLVDALLAETFAPGALSVWHWDHEGASFAPVDIGPDTIHAAICPSRRYSSTHDTDLATALEIGSTLGMAVPKSVWLFAVAIRDGTTFHQGLGPEMVRGKDRLVAMLCAALNA